MTSSPGTHSNSPSEVDFSVIRTSIQMGHTMVDQILQGVHYGSAEVRGLLWDECDIILECKVCRNLFRSFPNFVAHKRVYCMEKNLEKLANDHLSVLVGEEETLIINPEDTNNRQTDDVSKEQQSVDRENSVIEKVINQTFDGKSKAYQFYTKVAEDVEKKRIAKITNTLTVTSIPTTHNAMIVSHSNSDNSNADQHPKQSDITHQSPMKKKSLTEVCAGLAKGQILNKNEKTNSNGDANKTRILSLKSRMSSPKQSLDFLNNIEMEKEGNSVDFDTDVDMLEWTDDTHVDEVKRVNNDNVNDKEWLKYCDVKRYLCKVCKKQFSCLYSLKFHAQSKHSNSSAQFVCPSCNLTFKYFAALAHHLRNLHHKSEPYIDNIKTTLQKDKSFEMKELVEEDSIESTETSSPPKASVSNLLPCATGWKKCDKCGKVCWKAKSFKRHYSSCKGSRNKNEKHAEGKASYAGSNSNKEGSEKSSQNTKANKAAGNTKQSAALTKLHEKLIANVCELSPILQDSNNDKDFNKRIETGDLKNLLNSDNILLDTNTKINNEGIIQRESEKADSVSDANVVHETEELKKLKELSSAMEAGLKGMVNIVACDSKNIKPYSTRLSAHFKGNLTEDVLITDYEDDILNVNTDEQTTIIKEQKQNKEPKEIKQLEVSNEPSVNNKIHMDENINSKKEDETNKHNVSNLNTMYSVPSKDNISDRTDSDFIEKPKDESLSAKQNTLLNKCVLSHDGEFESLSATISASIHNLSKDGQTTDGKATPVNKELNSVADVNAATQMKTHEKMKIDLHLSASAPLPSQLHMCSLPVSPTASVHSTSTDIYNLKFKMTVKEMAELVESTSLTKFVRERKKKARKILNKKRTQNTNKAGASLDKPLKRRLQKRKKIVKKVYGTRHSASNEIKSSLEHDRKYSLRKVSIQSENSDFPTPESSWQARERKRLENTAGFVEKNYYAAKPTKCLETEHMDTSVEIKKSRNISIDKTREISKERIEVQALQQCKKNKDEPMYESLNDGCNKGQQISSVDGRPKEISRESRNQKRITCDDSRQESQMRVSRKRRLKHYAGYGEGRMHSDTSCSSRNSSSERLIPVYMVKTPEKIEEGLKAESTVKYTKNKQQMMESSMGANAKATNATFNDHTKMDEVSLLKANDILIEQMLDCITSGALKDKFTDHINEETMLVNVTNSTDSVNIDKNATIKKNSHNDQAIIEIDFPKVQSNTEIIVLQQDGNGKTDLISVTPKYRTRLATGSIFFDSELLKLSPTKAEKKIALAKVNKIAESSVLEVKAHKRSSPERKLPVGQKKSHRRTANGTPRYSLSTGVKKCLNCNKTFWKSKSYHCHLTRSACKAGNQQQNGGKKRPLSLSPSKRDTAQISGENQHIGEMESETKRAKTDSDAVEKVLKEMSASQNFVTNITGQEMEDEIANIDNCVRSIKGTRVDINIVSKDVSNESNGVESTHGSSTENRVSSLEFTETTNKRASMSDINVNDKLNNVSSLDLSNMVKSIDSNDSVNNNNDVKETNVSLEANNTVTMTDNICSLSGASVVTDVDSVDNESEFSGFTEDELKASELELSIVDVNLDPDEYYTANINLNTASQKIEVLKTMYSGSEEKVEMDVDKDLIDVLKKDSTKKSLRPVRKSAQNRFCHVEEIWVYKEPGKPIVEKVKNVKNREYVLDAENPLKLHCHNNKDVDKLIDEEKLKCRQCDTPCTSISNLRRHIIRHLGWKRYKCKVCAFACYDMSECRLHISRSHDENLTNKNFTRLVFDLKREAAKKRAAKRTNTLRSHKEQASVLECETYKKPGQTVLMKDIRKESTLVNNDNIFEKIENQKVISPKLTPQKLSVGGSVESACKKTEKQSNTTSHDKSTGIMCSEMESKHNPNDVHSPILKARMTLLKARMSLAKALGDK